MRGLVKGSIIQIHRARTVVVTDDGLITASGFGTLIMKTHPSIPLSAYSYSCLPFHYSGILA